MKPGTLTHTIAALLSSVTSVFAQAAPVNSAPAKVKVSKKSDRMSEDVLTSLESLAASPAYRHHLGKHRPVCVAAEHCHDGFLDRREPHAKQSRPQSGELVGQTVDQKLWRLRRSQSGASLRVYSGEIHAAAESILLCTALQRQSLYRAST
jgi:predicted HD phosphohydrolase